MWPEDSVNINCFARYLNFAWTTSLSYSVKVCIVSSVTWKWFTRKEKHINPLTLLGWGPPAEQWSASNSQHATDRYQLATGKYQLTTRNWQLADINSQLTNINWQLATRNWQLTDINSQLTDINSQLTNINWQLVTRNWQVSISLENNEKLGWHELNGDIYRLSWI